jgi:hypothetical protein
LRSVQFSALISEGFKEIRTALLIFNNYQYWPEAWSSGYSNQEVVDSNPAVYWIDVSYYISNEKKKEYR